MLKVVATQVVVSRGYEDAPALKYSEKGDSVRFRIGKKVYDPREEKESRWINISVKAFGGVCERIKKMQLKEGSFVNLMGRLDEDSWTDLNTGEAKSMMVIILDEVEYASGGKSKESKETSQQATVPQSAPTASYEKMETTGTFTGYEAFGGNPFFDED